MKPKHVFSSGSTKLVLIFLLIDSGRLLWRSWLEACNLGVDFNIFSFDQRIAGRYADTACLSICWYCLYPPAQNQVPLFQSWEREACDWIPSSAGRIRAAKVSKPWSELTHKIHQRPVLDPAVEPWTKLWAASTEPFSLFLLYQGCHDSMWLLNLTPFWLPRQFDWVSFSCGYNESQ